MGFFFYCNNQKRKTAFRNLKTAFPEKSSREICAIIKRSFYHFGLNIIEVMVAPRIYKGVALKGMENIGSDGGVLTSIHFGNWELNICSFAQYYNFAVLAQKQKHKGLNRFLNELREEGGVKVCLSLKELIRCLNDNYMVGVVMDHGAEKNASVVEFFSQLVPTPGGLIYLAKKFNKKIYPAFIRRNKGFEHLSKIGKPIDPCGKSDTELLACLNKIYEDYITEYPWEYFWYYKRFKYKRNRDIIILSDGKAGHLKQSKALSSFLSEEGYVIRSKTIKIEYKNKINRIVADIAACFSGRHSLWCWKLIPILLKKETADELAAVCADIVISTGSSIAPVNKLFSSFLGAKSAIVLRSNIPLSKFDLAVIPEHDRMSTENGVMIKGALFYPENLKDKTDKCISFFSLSGDKKICFFLGGPIKERKQFFENLKGFVPKLKKFAFEKGYRILVSTSRRTPEIVADYLDEEFKDFENTEALVIAGRNNYDFVFEGFTVLSDIVFVSSESVSMISEVSSLGKPCVCTSFEPEDDKRNVFFDSMKDEVSFLGSPYNIESVELKKSAVFESNRKALQNKLRELL